VADTDHIWSPGSTERDKMQRLYAIEEHEGRLRAALTSMVYETTHLSPRNDDGSHDCRISAATLAAAREALRT
jgi:hypothetical protein